MMKRFTVLLACCALMGSAAKAGVILQAHTTPGPGTHHTTIVKLISNSSSEVVASVDGLPVNDKGFSAPQGSLVQSVDGLGQSVETLTAPSYIGSYDATRDTHFMFRDSDLSIDLVEESGSKLGGKFTIGSSARGQEIDFAQFVTPEGTTIRYDFMFTDVSGNMHDVSGSFTTPEPATLGVLMLGGVGLLRRRRR